MTRREIHKTQIAIIGGGPSGLLLSQLLHTQGIDSIVIERQTRDHVLSRIRAGVLESGLVNLMTEAGVDARLRKEAIPHDGTLISFGDEMFRVDFREHTGQSVMVYGQTEVTRDLYDAREASDGRLMFSVKNVEICDADTDHPSVIFESDNGAHQIDCDFIAGCDGYHGVSRHAIPLAKRREFEKTYPFGWLGILSETPPINEELIYANSPRGFALCSMRNPMLSRYYIQCPLSDHPDDWSDDAFWDELRRRIPKDQASNLVTGPSIEKSIAPLRSFVTEPMQWGRLFLCGDAAHIVPPTGAKGLNTAASDVHYLYRALQQYYSAGNDKGLAAYSKHALKRVWKVERFSWWFSNLMHRYPDQSPFDLRMQVADLTYLRDTPTAQKAMAENYVGLPY